MIMSKALRLPAPVSFFWGINVSNVARTHSGVLSILVVLSLSGLASAEELKKTTHTVARPVQEERFDAREQLKRDREWLVSYLITNQGYNIEDIGSLESKIGQLSATQLQALIDAYRERDTRDARREAYLAWRQQSLERVRALEDRRYEAGAWRRSSLSQSVAQYQSRLDGDRRQSMEFIRMQIMRPHFMAFPQGGWFGGGFF